MGNLPPALAAAIAAKSGNDSGPTKGAISRRMKKKKGKGKSPMPNTQVDDTDSDGM